MCVEKNCRGEIMENKNAKVFYVRGEYRMTEDDNFKAAKNFALELAEKNLYAEVAKFLRENFQNLDDDDILDISAKFLKKNEPRFARESLPNDEMICYAELEAKINLDDLDNLKKNFVIFKLEKKVDALQNNLILLQNYLPELISCTEKISAKPRDDWEYSKRGKIYFNLGNYEQAIWDYNQAIKLNPHVVNHYYSRGVCYKKLGKNEEAEKDFAKAKELRGK